MQIVTAEDWKKVEDAIQPWRNVCLLIDGYEITMELVPKTKTSYSIFLYVNGEFKGEWVDKDCEERRRFMYRRESYLHSKELRDSKKKLPAKTCKSITIDIDKKYVSFTPFFPSFTALRRSLVKNNKKIEWGDSYPNHSLYSL